MGAYSRGGGLIRGYTVYQPTSYSSEDVSFACRWLPELNDMMANLKTRITSEATLRRSKAPTGMFYSVTSSIFSIALLY